MEKITKNRKYDKLDDDTAIEEVVVKKEPKEVKPKISFDTYFEILKKKSKVAPHHKAPLKLYMYKKGLETATLEEFDKAFSKY